MYIVKILVEKPEHAEWIMSHLESAEQSESLGFDFSVRITDKLSDRDARFNMLNEQKTDH